ncbi:MAG: hypothetical protein U9Q74_11400, partial [Gemmatimonadota bacterium]|nr:hypothetical protein [Gemmatimonadota bacterium]
MFVGHLALAYAAKRARPSANVGWYVAAATTADLLWPIFLLLGVERVSIEPGATAFNPLVFDAYPWSHSLLMLVVWGLVLTAIARAGHAALAGRRVTPARARPLELDRGHVRRGGHALDRGTRAVPARSARTQLDGATRVLVVRRHYDSHVGGGPVRTAATERQGARHVRADRVDRDTVGRPRRPWVRGREGNGNLRRA